MSDKKRRHKRKKISGKSFIILPVIFFISIYLILYVVLAPFASNIISATGMFFSDTKKNYNTTEYNSIFVPIPDDEPTVSDVPEQTEDKPKYIDIGEIQYPKYGEHFAQLIIDDCSIDTKLFMGDGDIALRNGAGVYFGSFIPGYGRTILVAGHNNTVFNGLKNAKKGQVVTIKTSYGNYTYEITETAVKEADDRTAFDLSADTENLIMYTCYPFDELGLTHYRYFVYAKFVSGPIITQGDKEVM